MLLSLSSPSGALVGSGTLNNPATGTTLHNLTEIVNQDIVSFTVDDIFLVLNMTYSAPLILVAILRFIEIMYNNFL